jgi:hypothetical protein
MRRPIGKVTDPLILLQTFDWIFANFMIVALVALTARPTATKKALFEEKAARSAAEAARQITEQSLQASEEAKAALMQDLQSAQASITATTEKLISKSSDLDFAVI